MSQDLYPNYAALKEARKEGTDYKITVLSEGRSTDFIAIAPHGGKIESCTSEIAREVASDLCCLYLFEGTMRNGNGTLHITSTNFDEPRALEVVQNCQTAIAIHGRRDKGDMETIYLGGLDQQLVKILATCLNEANFKTQIGGHKFPAVDQANICNRCATGRGVQLELPKTLRDSLLIDHRARGELVLAIRGALNSHIQLNSDLRASASKISL
jgi:phage replication-related protein YjqB (UPF0714/DUF867 family)